jgi:hypothetical protein
VLAVLNHENAFFRRCVVGVYRYCDILVAVMIMSWKAEGGLSLGHGEFFRRQAYEWSRHGQTGDNPKSGLMKLLHGVFKGHVNYRMLCNIPFGAFGFSRQKAPYRP